jgi:hypothetical protein
MICLLFRDFLLLATADDNDNRYMIQANIALCNTRIEETDNGRGIPLFQT